MIDICASTTSLTQLSMSESCFFAFAASGAVLVTSTLNKFLTCLKCTCIVQSYGRSTIPPKSTRKWSRCRALHQLLLCKIEQYTCCNGTFKSWRAVINRSILLPEKPAVSTINRGSWANSDGKQNSKSLYQC